MGEVLIHASKVASTRQFFEERGFKNLANLTVWLTAETGQRVCCVAFAEIQSPLEREDFDSDEQFWIAQGLFASAFILGNPEGTISPIRSLQQLADGWTRHCLQAQRYFDKAAGELMAYVQDDFSVPTTFGGIVLHWKA